MPLTIKPTARDILRRHVLDQLSGIGDIHIALAQERVGQTAGLHRNYVGRNRTRRDQPDL